MSQHVSLKEQAISAILYSVLSGEYSPDSIITEKELCTRLQMSKSPVREALVDLCSQGVLRSIPRQGYALVRYSEQNIAEIVQYRVLLECGILNDCFDHITPIQSLMLSNVVDMEFAMIQQKDMVSYWKDTMNFHMTLASFSGNEFVYNQLKGAISTTVRAHLQLYQGGSLQFPPSELHLHIVQSIKDKDKDLALILLEKDISSSPELVDGIIKNEEQPVPIYQE